MTTRKEWLGRPAPDFKLPDLNGNNVVLSSMRGKVVLLDFWSISSGPYLREMPMIEATGKTHKGDLIVWGNLAARIELMFGASYFWNETGPAVRFTIDDQSFLLMQEGEDCRLFLNVEGDEVELASLLGDDPSYEDKLLIVIGDVLEKHNLLMA